MDPIGGSSQKRIHAEWQGLGYPHVSPLMRIWKRVVQLSDLVLFFGNNTGSLALKFFDFLEEFMSDCMSGITKAEFCSRVEDSNVIK